MKRERGPNFEIPDFQQFASSALKAIQEFEQQEVWLLQLLDKAGEVNINRIRIPISIAPFIKLKIGDVFGFIIAHHQRHFVQIENTLPPAPKGGVRMLTRFKKRSLNSTACQCRI